MALLEFCLQNTEILPSKVKLFKLKEIKRIQYDLPFKIWIDGKVFFNEEYFTVLDFLYVAMDWQKKGGCEDMLYNSCETEDNPLISFNCTDDGWVVKSPWEEFKCKTYFTKDDLFRAIEDLKKACNISG